jgi:hypothetical protein
MNFKKRLWTSDDDAALAREIMAAKSLNEIAEKIGRTPLAVQNRASVLRLTFGKLRVREPINQ